MKDSTSTCSGISAVWLMRDAMGRDAVQKSLAWFRRRGAAAVLLTAVGVVLAGCASTGPERREAEFFTSGSREADQRASQRMARAEQLAGPEGRPGDVEEAMPYGSVPAQVEGKLTLYERLGGANGLAAIVDDFTARALEDPRVNWPRRGLERGFFIFSREREEPLWEPTEENVAELRKHLLQFLSLAAGGPAKYDGKNLKDAHAGMRITNAEFDAATGDLKAALDNLRIPDREQKELLAILESTRPQIVTER